MYQRTLLTDFTAGELSPKFSGRAELEIYSRGGATLENWVPFTQGGVITRPGTQNMGTTKSGATGRLIPFVVSNTYPFVVELTNNKMRFWLNGALVGAPLELTTTYTAAQLWQIQYCKVCNELYLVHPGHPIAVVTWVGGAVFTLGDLPISIASDVPAWAPTTAYVLDAVVTNGTPMKVYRCITAGTSAGSGGPTTEEDDITDGSAHWFWEYTQPFSQAGDYPSATAHFQGRMFYAGTVNDPSTTWASEPWHYGDFDYFNMISYTATRIKDSSLWANPLNPETEDITVTNTVYGEANAFDFTIASDNEETIYWLIGADALITGTSMSEWVSPPDINALNIKSKCRSGFGSAFIQATMMVDAPVMVQGTTSRAALREYAYLAESSELSSPDLSFAADHMLYSGCTQIAYMRMPQPTVFCVSNGEIAALLYNKPYSVLAWYHIIMEGGLVESVCVVPGTADDILYAVVNRGGTRCVEKFGDLWDMTLIPLDSWVQITIAGATQTGLERFNGQTVTIYNITDSTVHTAAVAGGSLTYPAGDGVGNVVRIGMAIECAGKTMNLNCQTATGPGQTAMKRISAVGARVLTSMPFQAGYSQTANLETAQKDDQSAWISAYTGNVRIPFQGNWDREGYVWFVQNQPYRSCILSLVPEIDA